MNFNFHPIQKVIAFKNDIKKKVNESELIQNEKRDLMSLRVKILYIVVFAWLSIIYFVSRLLGSVLSTYPQLDTLLPVIMDKLISIFYVITVVLITMLLAYLLGKHKFCLKLGPIEISVDAKNGNGNGNGDSNKENNNNQPVTDSRTGEPIK